MNWDIAGGGGGVQIDRHTDRQMCARHSACTCACACVCVVRVRERTRREREREGDGGGKRGKGSAPMWVSIVCVCVCFSIPGASQDRRRGAWARSDHISDEHPASNRAPPPPLAPSQTVLAAALDALLPAVAPVLPHLAEDAWLALPWPRPSASVFQVAC